MIRWMSCLLIITILLTGCWDRNELNEVSIVTGIAVDPGDKKKYKLTVEVVNAQEFGKQGAQGDTPVIAYTLEGDTLSELSNKMNVGVTRKLIYSHTRVLFINEKIAKEGLFGFLDFLERSGNFRNDFNIIITQGNKAADFTKITYPVHKSPSLKLHRQVSSLQDDWGGVPQVRLTDFISAIISKGRNPVATTASLKGTVQEGMSVENNQKLDPPAIITLGGISVFKKDKMLGTLSLEDTRNYLWTQDLLHTSLSLPCGGKDSKKEDEELFIDIRVTKSHTKMETTYKNNTPTLKLDIQTESKVQGFECKRDLTNINNFSDIEKQIEEHLTKEIASMIQSVQEKYGIDIFGFGEALNRKNPRKFKEVESDWDKEFTRANVEVNFDMHLLRTGIESKSYMTE